jgi:glycosyltransferase AcbS
VAFRALDRGVTPALPDDTALRLGWFDRLSPGAWLERADEIAGRAAALGDVDTFTRTRSLTATDARHLFDAAYERADFAGCERIAQRAPTGTDLPRLAAVRERCRVAVGRSTWRVRYRLPHAVRVEVVVGATGRTDRRAPTVHELIRHGDEFRGEFPGRPDATGLHVVLTLAGGRVTWDRIDHA